MAVFRHVLFIFRSNVLENTRSIAVGAHFTHTYKKELKKSTFRICGKKIRSADTLGAKLARKRFKEKMNNKNKINKTSVSSLRNAHFEETHLEESEEERCVRVCQERSVLKSGQESRKGSEGSR